MDLVLGGETVQNLVRLMLESWRKPLILSACATWILLNMLTQGSVDVMGLAYSMNKGDASNHTHNRPGQVNMSTLDSYYDLNRTDLERPKARMVRAHSLGQYIFTQIKCGYPNDSDIYNAPQSCFYFSRIGGEEFAYRFLK